MDNPVVVAVIAVVALLLVECLAVLALAGGTSRLGLAWRTFLRVAQDPAFAAKVEPMLTAPPPSPTPAKPSGVPVRLLAVLQREGRLVDFLMEDISGVPDAQIGAGVRDIHRKSQAALKEHLTLEPVMTQEEGAAVEVPAGFDPSAVRVVGQVSGQPPFRGTLVHRGWRVREIKLAPPPEGQDEMVLAPAEVEIA
jgi:hypothetical protein